MTKRKLADIQELREKYDMEHNPTFAKRKYLQQLIQMNNNFRSRTTSRHPKYADFPITELSNYPNFLLTFFIKNSILNQYEQKGQICSFSGEIVDFIKYILTIGNRI
ncbi:MAG: hypothetical protein JSW07_10045 [bacterium]|nr:MAG: hypothetical protein JSW07_10045 [bacterium]